MALGATTRKLTAFRDLGVGFLRGTPGHPRANGGVYTTDFGLRAG